MGKEGNGVEGAVVKTRPGVKNKANTRNQDISSRFVCFSRYQISRERRDERNGGECLKIA